MGACCACALKAMTDERTTPNKGFKNFMLMSPDKY
jgi:hypothetical protein